jgi:hypothetical protein
MKVPELEFAFSIRIEFPPGTRLRYPVLGEGMRGFVSVLGGTISGPRLQGEVIAGSGGDWPLFRKDGVACFDARYLLRATDGTIIHISNRGYAHASPESQKRLESGESIELLDNYCRFTPTFETAAGPHDWLTRTVLIGTGEKHADFSLFDYFIVR